MTSYPAPAHRGALLPAVGYVRVSTEEQAENGAGLGIQRDAIETLAHERGMGLLTVLADEGISGTKDTDDRPGLASALDHLGTAGTLVVYRLDRLARDLMVQEQILAGIWKMGAAVLSCSPAEQVYCQPDDPEDPARKLIRQVLGAVSGYERSTIALRMRRGRRRKLAETGYAGGPKPYGYDDAHEAAVLGLVDDMRSAGTTWRIVAWRLNHSGNFKRSGLPWTPQEIQRTHARAQERPGTVRMEQLAILP